MNPSWTEPKLNFCESLERGYREPFHLMKRILQEYSSQYALVQYSRRQGRKSIFQIPYIFITEQNLTLTKGPKQERGAEARHRSGANHRPFILVSLGRQNRAVDEINFKRRLEPHVQYSNESIIGHNLYHWSYFPVCGGLQL